MKLFLRKIALLLAIVFLCCCSLVLFDCFVVKSQYEHGYQAAYMDKMQRLQSIDEPKIILVGHSNLAFGIDSKRIEDAFSMPVVNLGFHGALGNAFHENMSKANINEGDIVVLGHSSFDLENVDGVLAWTTIGTGTEIFSLFDQRDYMSLIQAYPEYWKKNFCLWLTRTGNQAVEGCYSRNAFNEYGDVALERVSDQASVDLLFSEQAISVPKIDKECIERLNQYNRYVLDQGATLVVVGYPIACGKYSTCTEEDFEQFGQELQAVLDCEVISDYTDYFFPYEYFYDTHLHLTSEGTEARTTQLIEDLKAWFESK